jgi:hypothetical protein
MIQILRVLIFSALFLLTSVVSAQVLVPQSGNNQINCGSNTSLCDHAGCTSDYGTNADGYTIIETIGATSATLNGNYTLAAGESIIIYDGAGTGGSVITTLINSGTYNLAGTPGQQITVRFISDGALQAAGFSFTITYTGSPTIVCQSDIITGCDMIATFSDPIATDACIPAICASEDLATVMANFNINASAITGAIPNGFNFSDGITGTNIPDGGGDMYDGGNQLNTNISTLLPYSNGFISANPAFGAGGQYFTQKINNMFIMVADMNNVTDFIITGNNGADGSGILNELTYTVTSGCMDYDVFVKRINSAGDPSINQIFIVPTGTGATHTYGASTDNSLHTLSGLNTADRLYYLLVAGNGGYAYTNPEIEALVLDFLTQTGASGSTSAPVTVTQIAGLPSGSVFPAGTNVVTFEATSGLGVTATCSFNVISAVPGDPVIICPSDVTTACDMIGTFTPPITADPCGGICASEDLATVMANFITNGAAITGAIPNGFNFSDGITGTNIPDGGFDMYDGGNQLNTNISTLLPYSNGFISANPAFGAGGQYFTQKINNMFIMVADMNNVTNFIITGNNGADGSGIANDFTYTVTSGCIDYDVFVKRINGAGDPSINQIFIVPTGTGATHTYPVSTDNSLHTLSGIYTADRLYYLLVAGNGGYAYTDPEIQALVLDFLTQTGASSGSTPVPATVTQIAGLPSGSVFPAGTNVVTFEAETSLGVTATCSFNVITPASTAPTITAMPGSYCPNTTITLSAGAGIAGAGSSINWYTGPNGTGTFLGAGNSINYTTSVSTNIYARREGICNNTIDDLLPLVIKSFIYALNGTSSNTYCTDNSGWHHFFNGDEIILSCQGDFSGATAGFPVVTIGDNGTFYQQTEGPGTAPGCGMGSDPGEERFEMNRNWNLDFGGGVLNPPYNVRFYYSPAERTAIETAAVNWMATYPACGYTYKYANPLGFYWFKNVGSNYAAPDYDGLHVAGSNGSTTSGVNYDELTAITSFSGGSGAVILSPLTLLPVTLGSFNAVCGEGNSNTIHWSTVSENNSAYFTIERSRDSYNWLPVGQVQAAGSSSSVQYYSLTDKDLLSSDLLYYRLRQYDLDGASEGHGTIALECNEGALGFNINPNPASSTVAISVHGDIDKESTYFTFTDLNGRLIKHIDFTEGNGKLINVNIELLPSGYYIIRMFRDGQSIQMERMVKL